MFYSCKYWKWWNWDDVWDNICKIGKNAHNIKKNIDKTGDEGQKTILTTLNLLITSIITLITLLGYSEILSQNDKSDLKPHTLETTNTINISIDQLQTGDIIIYKSQGEYDRYLQFITTQSQTNPSEPKNNITTQITIMGPYNKIKNLTYDNFKKHYIGKGIKGDPNNSTASSKLVNKYYQEQKKNKLTPI
ncbi:MAG: hypothetical protein PHY59_09445 [Methanobacterium sp.]|nr:hypothetical protein [Methanobacterium sp.]